MAGGRERHLVTRRRLLLLLPIGIVIGLGIVVPGGGFGLVKDYHPLERGSTSGTDFTPLPAPQPANRERPRLLAAYRDGGEMRFGFSVRNAGRMTVRIEGIKGVPPPSYWVGLLWPFEVRYVPDAVRGWRWTDARPFKPFDLTPGNEAVFVMRAWMRSCEFSSAGVANYYSSENIRYSVLGVAAEQSVDLAEDIGVVSPEDCPNPRTVANPDRRSPRPLPTPSPY